MVAKASRTNVFVNRLKNSSSSNTAESVNDIDEKIRALEAELEGSTSSSSSDSSSGEEEDEDDDGVICLSSLVSERIKPLPSDCLPQAIRKKRKRKVHDDDDGPVSSASLLHFPETLRKLPFVCRPCGFQGKSLEEFNAHRASSAHAKVAKSCMKKLQCRPCKKQFNSPAQMEEHYKSKVHKSNINLYK